MVDTERERESELARIEKKGEDERDRIESSKEATRRSLARSRFLRSGGHLTTFLCNLLKLPAADILKKQREI